MKTDNNPFNNFKSDLPAALVVFLVAVPLCLGIALASDAPLFSGIIAGIVGGIVVGMVSGSSLGVSGPAAGLATIVATSIKDLGGIETGFPMFLYAVVIAGVFQVILGALKMGVIGYYFPNSVIKGMLCGIGIIILFKQIPHFFGYDKDVFGDFNFFQIDGYNTISELFYAAMEYGYNTINELFYAAMEYEPTALVISTLSLIILIVWERPFMKSFAISKIIQGPLVVVIFGIISNLILSGTSLELSLGHFVSIFGKDPIPASITDYPSLLTFPDFSAWSNPDIYLTAAIIAAVASLESLLSTEATDKLDPFKRVTPTNRELYAQGVGNIVSGLLGGLPVTQVIVRSSANIQSGGKTKMSAIVHGIMLMVCVLFIPNVLNMIPYASLAAILVMVGYKLARPAIFKMMYRQGPSQFYPFIITVVIVYFNLLYGVFIGLAVAFFHVLWNDYKIPYHLEEEDHDKEHILRLRLSEYVSFLNKARVLKLLDELPKGTHLIIDGSKSTFIHNDVLEIIQNFMQNQEQHEIQIDFIEPGHTMKMDPVKVVKNKVENLPY